MNNLTKLFSNRHYKNTFFTSLFLNLINYTIIKINKIKHNIQISVSLSGEKKLSFLFSEKKKGIYKYDEDKNI